MLENTRLNHILKHLDSNNTENITSNKTKYKYTLDGHSDNILTVQEREFYEKNGFVKNP